MAFEEFDPRLNAYQVRQMGKGWRLNAGNFLRYFELSPERPTSCRAHRDEDEGAVVIDLKSGRAKG